MEGTIFWSCHKERGWLNANQLNRTSTTEFCCKWRWKSSDIDVVGVYYGCCICF